MHFNINTTIGELAFKCAGLAEHLIENGIVSLEQDELETKLITEQKVCEMCRPENYDNFDDISNMFEAAKAITYRYVNLHIADPYLRAVAKEAKEDE